MVMNTTTALDLLVRIEAIIDAGRPFALEKSVGFSWDRDKEFIASARGDIASGSPERMQAVLDKMRNLSQGFGSYCGDLTELDSLLDEIHGELQGLIIRCR